MSLHRPFPNNPCVQLPDVCQNLQNKELSDDPEPALALQGISWVVRKAVGFATVSLSVKQYVGPPSPPSTSEEEVTHVDIEQTATAGLKGSTENRCLDFVFRDHTDWMFGHVKGQSKWMGPEDIADEFLKHGWEEGDAEKTGPGGKTHLYSHVESQDSNWTATQIWGFQLVAGERRYCRNILVKKEDERVTIRLVYDFVGEEE
jgi:hypothetical protein